jgi:hypothetical protein
MATFFLLPVVWTPLTLVKPDLQPCSIPAGVHHLLIKVRSC